MSNLANVLISYENGEKAVETMQYLIAAYFFRDCYFTYEYGELPIYCSEVEEKGLLAGQKYEEIVSNHLTQEDIEKLKLSNAKKGIKGVDIAVNYETFEISWIGWSKNKFDIDDYLPGK